VTKTEASTLRQTRGRGDRNGSAHAPYYIGRGGQGGAAKETEARMIATCDEGDRSGRRQARRRVHTLCQTRGMGQGCDRNGCKHAASDEGTRQQKRNRAHAASGDGDGTVGRLKRKLCSSTLQLTTGMGRVGDRNGSACTLYVTRLGRGKNGSKHAASGHVDEVGRRQNRKWHC
jgi:hypothetical protein